MSNRDAVPLMLLEPHEPMLMLAQAIWVYNHLPVMVFIFMFGACVGSFINVVNYRIPAGMSVTSPPSRCPTCGARLSFFRDNVPILGWLVLRGRCRYCGIRISSEYMLVELMMALLFVGLYVILYVVPPDTPFIGDIAGPWWFGGRFGNGFYGSMPSFLAFAFLLAGLFSMTVIDARTFTIPIQIPLFITMTAFIAYPVQGLFPIRVVAGQDWPIVTGGWDWFGVAAGGMLGVISSVVLLRIGIFKHSFADYEDYLTDKHETLADYPHARREMLVELKFLTPVLLGLIIGYWLGQLAPDYGPPVIIQAITGSFAGYLMGAGLIWAIRILGTLGFGREAMGMGDVHLLGAVGAVLGWVDPIFIFFIAPFSGILWALTAWLLGSVFKGLRRELPYGPHLAFGTLILMLLSRPVLYPAFTHYMGIDLPEPGLFP